METAEIFGLIKDSLRKSGNPLPGDCPQFPVLNLIVRDCHVSLAMTLIRRKKRGLSPFYKLGTVPNFLSSIFLFTISKEKGACPLFFSTLDMPTALGSLIL